MPTYQRLRVFVSSRMQELSRERQAVKTALETLKVDGWVFEEDAGARPETVQQTYLEEVESADLYLGIFWRGCGEHTIEEFDHARRLGKDCLIYEKRADLEGKRDVRLQAFLDRISQVETGYAVRWFETPDELGEIVCQDVARWQARRVRERQAPINRFALSLAEKRERDQLVILLRRVQEFWIAGVLNHSVLSESRIDLGLEIWTEPGEQAWPTNQDSPDQTSPLPPPRHTIVEAFDEAGRSLLILGPPGSGKTITLLELTRNLIQRAEHDPSQPIPVVFNLSSWAERRLPLFEWLADELSQRYRVPKKIGRSWLEESWLLPMLDGLDEVRVESRSDCLRAVQSFWEDNGAPGLVVCSRIEEYTALRERLRFGGAIRLQPLTPEQANGCLERSGPALAGLAAALKSDQALQTLAQTPLMLGVMSLAYLGADHTTVTQRVNDSPGARQNQIFRLYVERMFERKSPAPAGFPEFKVVHWLSWLARGMVGRSQSILTLEGLQPDWLGSMRQRALYGAVAASAAGMLWGLLSGFVGHPRAGMIDGVVLALGVLLCCWSPSPVRNGVAAALILGLPYWPMEGPVVALSTGLSAGLVGGAGIGSLSRIAPVETMSWSWSLFLRKAGAGGLVVGLAGAALGGLYGLRGLAGVRLALDEREMLAPAIDALNALDGLDSAQLGLLLAVGVGSVFGLIGGALGGLIGGLTDSVKADKATPNEGISRSRNNALGAFLVGSLIVFLILRLVGAQLYYPTSLLAGLGLGVGLIVGLNRGGSAVIKHYSLRLVLWLGACIPFRLIPFLDHCVKLVFLQRVGGGYIFMHRMLLEYFAGLREDEMAGLATPGSSAATQSTRST